MSSYYNNNNSFVQYGIKGELIAKYYIEHFKNELGARTWRHNKLCRIAEFFDSQTVVIGHTASDVIETALWHIVRGTSPKGLISLQPRRALKIYHFSRIPSYLFLTKYHQKTENP